MGRHRAKLDEIRESLKAYEHEAGLLSSHVALGSLATPSSSSVSHSDITNDNAEVMNFSSSSSNAAATTTTVSSAAVSNSNSFRVSHISFFLIKNGPGNRMEKHFESKK